MTFLQKYKFVVAERPLKVSGKSPIEKRKDKMIVRLEEQIAVAQAEMSGKQHSITTTNKDGKKVPKNIKHWYWLEPNGAVNCELSFGPKVFKIGRHNANAFQVADMKELITALEEAKGATTAGEFDALIEAAAARKPKP